MRFCDETRSPDMKRLEILWGMEGQIRAKIIMIRRDAEIEIEKLKSELDKVIQEANVIKEKMERERRAREEPVHHLRMEVLEWLKPGSNKVGITQTIQRLADEIEDLWGWGRDLTLGWIETCGQKYKIQYYLGEITINGDYIDEPPENSPYTLVIGSPGSSGAGWDDPPTRTEFKDYKVSW